MHIFIMCKQNRFERVDIFDKMPFDANVFFSVVVIFVVVLLMLQHLESIHIAFGLVHCSNSLNDSIRMIFI